MGKVIDLTGQKFGRLTVLKMAGKNKWGNITWLCDCECGNKIIANSSNLIKGETKSCGCLQKEIAYKSLKKYNIYDLSGEYGIGYTFKGEEFYFDLEDYDKIKDYCWNIVDGYVKTRIDKNSCMYMHRLVMSAKDNMIIDHIHSERRNDNRKINLRQCIHQQNMINKGLCSNNTSGVTGVSYRKDRKKWVANITYKGKMYRKSFKNFEDAVAQRKKWEEEFFGEYSYNNSQKQII